MGQGGTGGEGECCSFVQDIPEAPERRMTDKINEVRSYVYVSGTSHCITPIIGYISLSPLAHLSLPFSG